MKKIFLFLLTVVVIHNISYAAFPVSENINSISVSTELPISGGDGAATTSMILAGIAIFFNLLMFVTSGWAVLLPMFFAGVFYLAAFIFGLIGLRSNSKKWQAFIGLFSGVLVLLVLLISTGSTGGPEAKD